MSALDFVASVLKSAAWPSVIVFAVLLFGRQIRELLASLSELSFTKDGFTGKFDRALREASRDVDEVKVEFAAKLSPATRQLLDGKGRFSGNAARIVAGWQDLEEVVRQRLTHAGVDPTALGASALLQAGFEHNLITEG